MKVKTSKFKCLNTEDSNGYVGPWSTWSNWHDSARSTWITSHADIHNSAVSVTEFFDYIIMKAFISNFAWMEATQTLLEI